MFLEVRLITLLLWAIAIFIGTLELGYRLGRRRLDKSDEPDKSHSNTLQGATLGLLALLLGFTFAMSVSRFDNRKTVIMEQANAIGTAELRSRLLGTPLAERAAPLFRAYVQAWMDYRNAVIDVELAKAAEQRAFQIENDLWNIAREATAANPLSHPAALYAAAMNEVIDAHERRHRSIQDRVPDAVILLLFGVSALALGQVAYSSGLAGRRWAFSNATFAVLISIVLVIILDIDRPRRGFVQVSQDSMLRLQQSLAPATH